MARMSNLALRDGVLVASGPAVGGTAAIALDVIISG
jgi:hypothetical protein